MTTNWRACQSTSAGVSLHTTLQKSKPVVPAIPMVGELILVTAFGFDLSGVAEKHPGATDHIKSDIDQGNVFLKKGTVTATL